MLLLFLLIISATGTYGGTDCDSLVEVKRGDVTELLNPSYPSKDSPKIKCSWTAISAIGTRIILVCPFNEGSDRRSDERDHCGATMTVQGVDGKSKENCRDMTFAVMGNSNRMLITYKNDDGMHYKRDRGFKCYLYAKQQSLFASYDPEYKELYKPETFTKCDFFIKLGKNEFVRLATTKFKEDADRWRKCRWTAVSPKNSRISVTCPYTEKPPDPVLMQAEPCSSEFNIQLLQDTLTYQCSEKSFSETSTKNRIVFEELSLMRLPKRDFECYIHSESRDEDKELKRTPYINCDEYVDLNTTGTIKFPHHSGWIRSGDTCRWNVNAPENAEISFNCTQEDSRRQPDQKQCLGKFNLITPAGDVLWLCQNSYLKSVFRQKFHVPYNGITLIYENDNHDAVHPFTCTLTVEQNCKDCIDPDTKKLKRSLNSIRLHGREVREILSPHYPEKEGPGSTGRWTVIADEGRQIILVCPFYHSVEELNTDQDEQPCNGEFVISPDREDDSMHCRDRGFSRIGRTRRMIFSFKNNGTQSIDAFKCYVYAEVRDRLQAKLDERDYQPATRDYAITLDGINVVSLVPPTNPEGTQRRNWETRWHITAPNDSVVTIACHFTDKPPAPLTIQVVPCYSEFTFTFRERSELRNCNERSFSRSADGWMILKYRSKGVGPSDDFVCVAYTSNKTTTEEVKDPTDAMKTCDTTIPIDDSQIVRLNPTNYTVTKPLDRKYRCWVITAPLNNRIGITCPPSSVDDRSDTKACHNQFIVITEFGTQSMHCNDQRFAITSADSQMKLIYEDVFGQFIEPFTCEIYAMETDLKLFPLAAAESSSCTRNIQLTTARQFLESPNFPHTEPGGSSCTWTVEAPSKMRIVLTCPSLQYQPKTHYNLDSCLGVSYFTVTSEGETNIERYCRTSAFMHTSAKNKMTVVYHNPSQEESEIFRCELRAFKDFSWNIETNRKRNAFFYENCDHLVNLTYHSTGDLTLPKNYKKSTACRWRVVSPPDSRIFISCPLRENIPETSDGCAANYTVTTAESATRHCRTRSLSETSPSNWSVLTYNYPKNNRDKNFACYAYAEPKLPDNTCVNCNATVPDQSGQCNFLVTIKRGEVKALLNPSYPKKDGAGKECTWSVVADLDRRIVLVCPFNYGSDTITDERFECGAKMRAWDAGGEPTLYCRDQTFARVGTSNRMFIKYKNDDGGIYNRVAGFKCFMYATMASLSQPYDEEQKETFKDAHFGKCDFVIRLSKYDIVRLATSHYPEDREKWRRCRWTAISPGGSKVSVTCPYTEKPPDPLLIQAEPCTNEYKIWLSQNAKTYQCSNRSFSETSNGNKLVIEEMSIMRQPSRDSECYVHTELPITNVTSNWSPYGSNDHVIELTEAITLKTPDHPAEVRAGTKCRWTLLAPNKYQISLNCFPTDDDFQGAPGEECFGEFDVMLPSGNKKHFCQRLGTKFPPIYSHQALTVIYKNTLSYSGIPFECNVTLLREDDWTKDTETIENEKTNKIIKLNKREVVPLLSPNYPSNVPAGSTGRWTVVSDMDRRIVLVCPFQHDIETAYGLADKQPCNGQFTVSPDNGEESYHCQDRGFSRIGANHIMVMTYKNQLDKSLEAFTCYAYAELKERWDRLENETDGVEDSGHDVALRGNKVVTLLPPDEPEGEKKAWRSFWNVSARFESQITIACHFTDKPPAPLTIQVVPCYGQFTVTTSQQNKSHLCNERAFTHTSDSGWVALTYENFQKRAADNFVCVAYSSNKTSSYAVTSSPYKNDECDYLVTLERNEILKLDSTQYDLKKESGRSSCRWTFVAPTDSRVALVCPLQTDSETPKDQKLRCQGQFTVFTEGRDKTLHCTEATFSRTSENNRLVLIYETEFSQSMERFGCEVYAKHDDYHVEFTYLKDPGTCKNNITLETTQDFIKSPNYPLDEEKYSSCTWTVVAPRNRRIILTCPAFQHLPTDIKIESCLGLAYFTAYSGSDVNSKRYCHSAGFTHSSVKNEMTVIYTNPSDRPSEGFNCSLRLETESPWNECDSCKVSVTLPLPYEKCDQFFKLIQQSSTALKVPDFFHEGKACRWTMVSPPDTRILVSCPDKKKVGETCTNFYTVSSAGTMKKICGGTVFHEPSPSNWAILTQENVFYGGGGHSVCYAYVENLVPREECPNCKGVEKLDYRRCDTFVNIEETGLLGGLPTPENLVPGMPCLWRVRSPPLTAITLTCDADRIPDDETWCRGLITIYTPGKKPQYVCRHFAVNVKSADNKLDIAYGNQFGVTQKPFKCYVQAKNTSCHFDIALPRLLYNEFVHVIGPDWNSSHHDILSCTYSLETPVDTRMHLICDGFDRNESLAVSTTGDRDTSQATVFHIRNVFDIYSVQNKMTYVYIMDETTEPNSATRCRIHVDRNPPLGPECNCGHKCLNRHVLHPSNRRELFPRNYLWCGDFSMSASIHIKIPKAALVCFATIISSYHAITSGNCLEKVASYWLYLHVPHEDGGVGKSHYVTFRHIDEKKTEKSGLWDIGIVGVDKPIALGDETQPVCLTFKQWGQAFFNEEVVALGWDNKPNTDSFLHILKPELGRYHRLRYTLGHIVPDSYCSSLGRFLPRVHICMNHTQQSDVCNEFEGGPVLWPDPVTGLYKLIGVTINHRNCEATGYRSIAMNMSHLLGWVVNALKEKKTLKETVTFCKGE